MGVKNKFAKMDYELREILSASILKIDQINLGLLDDMEENEKINFISSLSTTAHNLYEKIQKSIIDKAYEIEELNKSIEIMFNELNSQKKESERLLENTLPQEIITELKHTGKVKPKQYNNSVIIFIDIVNFTKITENLTPDELIKKLDNFFSLLDNVTNEYNYDRIKTIGDCYMCVGGIVQKKDFDHKTNLINGIKMCKKIVSYMEQLEENDWNIRIGINVGKIIAGIVGTRKLLFDIWGDAVNVAARIETASKPNKINVSESVYEIIKDHFKCENRGHIMTKNKGELKMYFVGEEKT